MLRSNNARSGFGSPNRKATGWNRQGTCLSCLCTLHLNDSLLRSLTFLLGPWAKFHAHESVLQGTSPCGWRVAFKCEASKNSLWFSQPTKASWYLPSLRPPIYLTKFKWLGPWNAFLCLFGTSETWVTVKTKLPLHSKCMQTWSWNGNHCHKAKSHLFQKNEKLPRNSATSTHIILKAEPDHSCYSSPNS